MNLLPKTRIYPDTQVPGGFQIPKLMTSVTTRSQYHASRVRCTTGGTLPEIAWYQGLATYENKSPLVGLGKGETFPWGLEAMYEDSPWGTIEGMFIITYKPIKLRL